MSGLDEITQQRQAPPVLVRSVRKPSGYYEIMGPEGKQEGETLSCVHCQYIWKVESGSGRKRGFCFQCAGPTCGKPQCEERCIPFEQALEQIERRDILHRKMLGVS